MKEHAAKVIRIITLPQVLALALGSAYPVLAALALSFMLR